MPEHLSRTRGRPSGDRLERSITLATIIAMLGFAGLVFADSGSIQGAKKVSLVGSGAKIAKPIALNHDDPTPLPADGAPPPADSTFLAAPANDTCAGAVPLVLNRITKGTTVGANDDYQTPATTVCFAGIGQTPTTAPGRDVVFSFTAPTDGRYSFRIIQQSPLDVIRAQNEVLYLTDCAHAGTVNCLAGANRPQSSAFPSSTGASNNQSEEVSCYTMTSGQTVFVVFDDGSPGACSGNNHACFADSDCLTGQACNPVLNAGGTMSVEPIVCNSEVEPNGTPATATPYVCGTVGVSNVAPLAHCYLGTRAGNVCTRSTFLEQTLPNSNMRCSISNNPCAVVVATGIGDCPAGEGICQQRTDLDCDPRCDIGPNAGRSCTTQAFCNPVSDQGATCAGACQVESVCVNTATGVAGVACTPVCVGSSIPSVNGRYCSSSVGLSGCPGGGACTTTPLVPTPGATCVTGEVCSRQYNEGDEDFFSLGVVPAGSKVFAGIDAKSSNDYDWRMRITTDTQTLQFDDDDVTARGGANAPTIAGAVADGTPTYIKVSRTAARTSEPYELYAHVRPPIASAQLEAEGPNGNDFNYGWPGDVLNANAVTAGGYVRGTFAFQGDADCFKFLVNKGDLMDWFGDANPTRVAGATSIIDIPEPIIYDAEPAGISNFIFGANPRKNTTPNVNQPTLNALSPAVTSSYFQWRASYTGMLEVCYYGASVPLGQGTPAHPNSWAGSMTVNCGPLQPTGPGSTTADVSITETGPAGPVRTGQFAVYAITTTNNGAEIAQEVRLLDTLPPSLSFVSMTIDDGFGGNNTACFSLPTPGTASAPFDCINTSMAPGSTTTYTLTVQVNNCIGAGVNVSNTAAISTVSTDPNPSNDSATVTFTTSENGSCVDLVCDASSCVANICTNFDHCEAGVCVTTLLICDDNSVCTDDSCDPTIGCVNDTSQAGDLCVDFNPCTVDACDPVQFCVFPPEPSTTTCDDGNACTGIPAAQDSCDGAGECVGGQPLACDDNNACTANSCNPTLGCVYAPIPCDDSNVCNGLESCVTSTGCVAGTPLACGDGNVCTNDTCVPASGCAHANNANACNDGNPCTTGDTCGGGLCQPGAGALNCNDNNPCTDDSCDAGSGCVHTNNTSACDDGNLCTTGDTCGGGTCNGAPVICNDGNVCTADTCDPATGLCVYTGGDCVVAVDPPDNMTGTEVSTNVTLTYLDPIDPATVTASTFRLIGPGDVAVPATLLVSTSGTRPTLDPVGALEPETTYRVETTSGILGPGSVPTQPFTSYFRTGPAAASTEIPEVSEPTTPLPTQSRGGASISRLGDLNGDGIQDFGSGAPGSVAGGGLTRGSVVDAGAVLVYFGSADAGERGQPDIIFTGVSAHDRVGVSVAGGFDFNNDGYRDIVIGAEQVDRTTNPNTPTPTGNGRVYLIFFNPTDTAHYPNIANPALADTLSLSLVGQPGGIPGVVFEGAAFGDQAGFSVAGGGTSTPGGGMDIVIGAPGANPGNRTDAGAAYIVFDSPTLSGVVSLTRISDGLPDQVPGKAYLGAEAGDNLGFSTAFAGAVVSGQTVSNGGVLMGAPAAAASRGTVILAPGDPDTTPIIVDAVGTTHPGFQIVGTQPGEQLGLAVADGGDALADDIPDLLVGAPTYDAGSRTNAGRAIQTTQMIPSGIYNADAVGTTIRGVIWTGEATGDQLGSAVASMPDVTGDGYDDVVLGAPFVDPVVGGVPQTDAGAVYLIDGSPAAGFLGSRTVADVGTVIAGQSLTGTQAGEHAGSSIAGTGDISGDGQNDFAAGAPDRDADAGTVYMVLRSDPPPVGNCGPAGCQVADLVTGAEVDLSAGALATAVNITVTGILDRAALPAPVPAGKMLLGAAAFTPDGQAFLPPFATIHLPTVQPLGLQRAPSEVLPLFYYNGSGWAPAGINGTTGPNPSYPALTAVNAVVGVLHVYAVFLNDADEDGVRDELDNCPAVPNPAQVDTDGDSIGDACECVNVTCGDSNVCTDDGCNPAFGCFHTNSTANCDDGDPCTAGDVCGGGTCNSGAAITAPPEAQNGSAAADKVTFTWSATLYATTYDAVRGLTSALAVGPGAGDEVCFHSLVGAALIDATVPASGTAFWYLARGVNSCGVGSFGQQSDGTPRITTTCP